MGKIRRFGMPAETAGGNGHRVPDGSGPELAGQPIGAYLRSQRELRGMTLAELAALTRIPIRSLERLEAGYFDGQNDGFVRGFVRTVGAGLGLDPDDTLARTLSEPTAEVRRGIDLSARALQVLIVLLLMMALMTGSLWIWGWWIGQGRVSPGQTDEIVQRRDPVRALAEAQAAISPAERDSAAAPPLAGTPAGTQTPAPGRARSKSLD